MKSKRAYTDQEIVEMLVSTAVLARNALKLSLQYHHGFRWAEGDSATAKELESSLSKFREVVPQKFHSNILGKDKILPSLENLKKVIENTNIFK